MKKKRIAFVVNGLYGGGAERILQILLANLDRQKYDITLINHREEAINELYPQDITYKSILKSIKKESTKTAQIFVRIYNKLNLVIYNNCSPRIFRLLYVRDRYDAEIAFIEGYATRIVSGGRSTRKIAWVHIDLKLNPWTNIAFRSLKEQKKCYSYFDTVVSVSESVRKSFEELFSRKSIVIYNPIDAKEIRKMSSQAIANKEKDFILFVSVGRLVPQKGYDRLIPIVGKLVTEGFNLRLWIVGEGAERNRLEELIREWKLEGIVTLLGHQSNPYPYVATGDFFVCSSRSEGYSTVVTEAIILQRPVITTLCAGMEELLEDGKYGMIVENKDSALLDGMRNILKDKRLTSKYAARLRKGSSRFSLQCRMNEIYSIIDS